MKKYISVLLVMALVFGLCAGCVGKKDYSEYSFVNVQWTRSTEFDTEYIRFSEDGEFSYYCACGNPVNDSDLCEGYSYNDSTKTIKLDYMEEFEETVTKVVIVSCTDETLVLDFDGDVRTFTKCES